MTVPADFAKHWIMVIRIFLMTSLLSYADYRPNLYLNGNKLADCITPWIIHNTPPERRKEHHVYLTTPNLMMGFSINFNKKNARTLYDWMIEQPDHSIYPQQLYKKAIEISSGSVEEGMMLVWNLLYKGWTDSKKEIIIPTLRN